MVADPAVAAADSAEEEEVEEEDGEYEWAAEAADDGVAVPLTTPLEATLGSAPLEVPAEVVVRRSLPLKQVVVGGALAAGFTLGGLLWRVLRRAARRRAGRLASGAALLAELRLPPPPLAPDAPAGTQPLRGLKFVAGDV